jgi:hypothetical protein
MRNLPSLSDRTTIIILDFAHELAALKVAKDIAAKTGRIVTILNSDGAEVCIVFPTKH